MKIIKPISIITSLGILLGPCSVCAADTREIATKVVREGLEPRDKHFMSELSLGEDETRVSTLDTELYNYDINPIVDSLTTIFDILMYAHNNSIESLLGFIGANLLKSILNSLESKKDTDYDGEKKHTVQMDFYCKNLCSSNRAHLQEIRENNNIKQLRKTSENSPAKWIDYIFVRTIGRLFAQVFNYLYEPTLSTYYYDGMCYCGNSGFSKGFVYLFPKVNPIFSFGQHNTEDDELELNLQEIYKKNHQK